jgi:hypothetical protein
MLPEGSFVAINPERTRAAANLYDLIHNRRILLAMYGWRGAWHFARVAMVTDGAVRVGILVLQGGELRLQVGNLRCNRSKLHLKCQESGGVRSAGLAGRTSVSLRTSDGLGLQDACPKKGKKDRSREKPDSEG